jgi:hypothetical protein
MLLDRQLRDLDGRRHRLLATVRALRDARVQRPAGGPSRGLAAGDARVGEQLVERPVAGDPAGRQHVVGQAGGEEAGRPLVVEGLISGHVQERGGRGPADSRDEQVALHLGPVGALDGAHAPVAPHPRDVAAPPGVHHAHDLHAGLL